MYNFELNITYYNTNKCFCPSTKYTICISYKVNYQYTFITFFTYHKFSLIAIETDNLIITFYFFVH